MHAWHRIVLLVLAWASPAFSVALTARRRTTSARPRTLRRRVCERRRRVSGSVQAENRDPALLYNAAQSYRLAGKNEKALILYRNYVQLYPTRANIEDVRAQIAKSKDAIAAQEKAKTNPPTSTVAAYPPLQPSPLGAAIRLDATAAAERPLYKKWWFWTIVGGVVAAGVVTAAVVTTTSKGSWSQYPMSALARCMRWCSGEVRANAVRSSSRCKSPSESSGFGLNVRIEAGGLDAATRAQIKTAACT